MKNTLAKIKKRIASEEGEVNMIAIVLILLIVILLAAIFKDKLTEILENILDRVVNEIDNIS